VATSRIQVLEALLQSEQENTRRLKDALATTTDKVSQLETELEGERNARRESEAAALRDHSEVTRLARFAMTDGRIAAARSAAAHLIAAISVLEDAGHGTALEKRTDSVREDCRDLLAALQLETWQTAQPHNAAEPADVPTELGAASGTRIPEMVLLAERCGRLRPDATELTCVRHLAVSRYAVTFDEYDAYAQATGRPLPPDNGWGRGRRPVINVSFPEAVAYADWLRARTGQPVRLPTEAEWIIAAGGSGRNYPWGNDLGIDRANCRWCGSPWDGSRTAPVGSFPPNDTGVFEIVGNVWQWTCSDVAAAASSDAAKCATSAGSRRIVKGGSWFNGPAELDIDARQFVAPTQAMPTLGIRLVLQGD